MILAVLVQDAVARHEGGAAAQARPPRDGRADDRLPARRIEELSRVGLQTLVAAVLEPGEHLRRRADDPEALDKTR